MFLAEGIQKFLFPAALGVRMVHEARTDWCMFLGALFLLIVGPGAWSIDAWVASHR